MERVLASQDGRANPVRLLSAPRTVLATVFAPPQERATALLGLVDTNA
jgi:hypothetical protein